MRSHPATVIDTSSLSAHLMRVTLGGAGLADFTSTGVPDEYVSVQLPAAHTSRVYTVSGHRRLDDAVVVDVDVVTHDGGVGSEWAQGARAGDAVAISEAHGMYAASTDASWQLLACDLTGLPALARILVESRPDRRLIVRVVATDAADVIDLPSPAEVSAEWIFVGSDGEIPAALERAVRAVDLPPARRYVWLAGEAQASRAVRRYLRRELGWSQDDFSTCGYWQLDAAAKSARYQQVAALVDERTRTAYREVGHDRGAYLDALDDIFDEVGL